jgi:DNA-binding HxlR family transcriptional regulator
MDSIGDGEVLRAGARPLLLLAATLNFLIVRALSNGPLRLAELRRATGLPAQTTLRGHLASLGALGIVAKRPAEEMPYAVANELTPLGHDLIGVAGALESWLQRAPDGPVSLQTGSAKGVVKAYVDGWGSTLLGALAERPLSLTELDRVIPALSYPALERRLSSMRMAGLVEPLATGRGGTPYAVTGWARQGVVPLAAAGRCEQLHMRELAPALSPADVGAGFMLALPLAELPAGGSGCCQLTVTIDGERDEARDGGRGGVEVTVAAGRIVGCSTELSPAVADSAAGPPASWFGALGEGRADLLEYAGGKLSRQLVDGLRAALVAPSQSTAGAGTAAGAGAAPQAAAASRAASSPRTGTTSS